MSLLWRRKIRESKNSNPKGRCEGERSTEGRGEGRKNTPARYHCSFGKRRTLANGSPDWYGLGKVDWSLSIKWKSILFIPFSFACNCGKELVWIQKWQTQERFLTLLWKQVFWNWNGWECRECYAMRKSKRFLHWRQDKICLQWLAPFSPLFSSFNSRFRQQNIRAPEENACIAGYDLHGSM